MSPAKLLLALTCVGLLMSVYSLGVQEESKAAARVTYACEAGRVAVEIPRGQVNCLNGAVAEEGKECAPGTLTVRTWDGARACVAGVRAAVGRRPA